MIGLGAMILVWFLPWRFQVNDDVIMMWLVSGAYTGDFENYVVFIHPALSWALSQLYVAWYNVSWYSLVWFLCVYYSFLLIHLRIKLISSTPFWAIFFNSLALVISIHLCIFPQFTLVSGFLAIAAWVYILQENTKGRLIPSLLFLIGVVLSILIRAEAFVLVAAGVVFYFFVLEFKLKSYWKLILSVTILFTFLLSAKVLYEKNSPYSDFLVFNELRHQVIDHPVFYEKIKDKAFKNDAKWHHFSHWFFQDSAVTLDDLKAKKQLLDKEYFSTKYIFKSFARYWEVQTAEMFKGFISLLLIILFVGLYRKDKKLVFLAIWLSLFFLANHIFHFRGRVVFLFYIVLLFPVLEGDVKKITSKYVPVLLSLTLLVVLLVHFYNFRSESYKRKNQLTEFNTLLNASENTALLMLEGLPLEYFSKEYDQKNQVPFLIHGWISRSPFQEKALNRFGYQSLTDVNKFDLIAVKQKAPFYTKDFMSSIGSDFFLDETIETETLILFKYRKVRPEN